MRYRLPLRGVVRSVVRGVVLVSAGGLAGWLMAGEAEPDRTHPTTQELVKSTFGTILLYDKDSGVVVSAKRTAGGKLQGVQIYDAGHTVIVELNCRGGGQRPELNYSVGMSEHPMRMAAWRDLNCDGVFDFRLLVGDWPQLGNQTGPRAYLGGQWLPASLHSPKEGADDHPTAQIGGQPYHFDLATGQWSAGAGQ